MSKQGIVWYVWSIISHLLALQLGRTLHGVYHPIIETQGLAEYSHRPATEIAAPERAAAPAPLLLRIAIWHRAQINDFFSNHALLSNLQAACMPHTVRASNGSPRQHKRSSCARHP